MRFKQFNCIFGERLQEIWIDLDRIESMGGEGHHSKTHIRMASGTCHEVKETVDAVMKHLRRRT